VKLSTKEKVLSTMHFVAWQVNHERSAYGTSTKRLKMKVYPQYTFFFKLSISLDLLNFL